MGDPRRNVELKAVDPDPARSLAICRKLGANDEGVLTQRDTYYAVARGRLKLREQEPGRAHLIQYERAARPEQRESRYRIAEVADAAAAHAALEAALGVECVVAKRRRLFLWRGVRIHLDEVEGLGSFVELEAVAEPGSDLSAEHERIATLRESLAIDDARLVAHGYAQLMGHDAADDAERLRSAGNRRRGAPGALTSGAETIIILYQDVHHRDSKRCAAVARCARRPAAARQLPLRPRRSGRLGAARSWVGRALHA